MSNLQAYYHTRELFTAGDNATTEAELTKNVLEALVDRFGVAVVTSALGDVCDAKAEHAVENWQDKTAARKWRGAANALNRTALSQALEV